MSPGESQRRLATVHQGVYAVGHANPSQQGKWVAAVLACGTGTFEGGAVIDHWGAAVSHRSAAELWGLLRASDGPVDVVVPGDGGKARRRGIRLHRSISLSPVAVTLRDGVPVTTPARTLADLRRVASGPRRIVTPRELRRAIREAEVLDLPLDPNREKVRERSDLEEVFRALCHRGKQAFLEDRARDLRLRRLGYDVIRLSDEQVANQQRRVAETLAAALRVGADGGPDAGEAG